MMIVNLKIKIHMERNMFVDNGLVEIVIVMIKIIAMYILYFVVITEIVI